MEESLPALLAHQVGLAALLWGGFLGGGQGEFTDLAFSLRLPH
jgi:hypothetical protein